jgi:hypothetical protein
VASLVVPTEDDSDLRGVGGTEGFRDERGLEGLLDVDCGLVSGVLIPITMLGPSRSFVVRLPLRLEEDVPAAAVV